MSDPNPTDLFKEAFNSGRQQGYDAARRDLKVPAQVIIHLLEQAYGPDLSALDSGKQY